MRVAAIYDIHANLPALEAVIREIHDTSVDRIVVGGDVLPGPMPRETLEALSALDIPTEFIMGNGDRAVLEEMRGEGVGVPEQFRHVVRWVAQQLDDEHRQLITRWPKTRRLEIDGLGPVLFCHATPQNDTDIFTKLSSEDRLLPIFQGLDVALVVCGHTHMQFDRRIGPVRVLNAGSVGMPYGEPRACWLLLGPDVQLRRTAYDLVRAAERIRASGYPQADEFAAADVLAPKSEQEALDLFARVDPR